MTRPPRPAPRRPPSPGLRRVLPRRSARWIAAAVAAGILASTGGARAEGWDFKRGVNLSNWFANTQRQPLLERDFRQIKAAGFDHVRIPINPEYLGFSLFEADTGRILFDFAPIDRAIDWAMGNGLGVIFDVHPSEGFTNQIEQDPRSEAGFLALWQHIADHYKLASNSIAFEILNEPGYVDAPAKYSDLLSDLVAAIRKALPKHLLIIDAPDRASIDGLAMLKPVKDGNVAYAFHFYEPYLFTHQGMESSFRTRSIRYFRSLPYPSAQADANGKYIQGAPDAAAAKQELADYIQGGWDAAKIREQIKVASDWAASNHAQVICTEFGAYRRYVPTTARYQWIADTRKALEAGNIGWDLWDYTDLFGITKLTGATSTEPRDGSVRLIDPEKGSRDIEPEALTALFGP